MKDENRTELRDIGGGYEVETRPIDRGTERVEAYAPAFDEAALDAPHRSCPQACCS